ncbi:histidine decarboxylase [Micromonospora echinofusca]|uniref:Histidine decarboxylase n=1 Tax=Micromonospora echinofusca TaxID=47858 RepID=A0ABS3W146_MICEH|nr:histidine decarboxylase [Micromonospora echinofusca]MBO4210520.1 histidine decarboxylase [Micromonospora echinofusca]
MTHTPTLSLTDAADLHHAPIDVATVLDHLVRDADAAAATSIGFPGAVDLDQTEVMTRLGRRLWNNIGDPADTGGTAHTRVLERAVVAWVDDILAMPADDRWGYVTTGGTEGNLSALHAAHRRHPTARIYYSTAAHYSIPKIVEILGARGVVVDARPDGEMDYAHLAAQVRRHRRWPAIVVATAGTTLTEAVDDSTRIRAILDEHHVRGHLHVDAALSGIPLALDGRLRFDDDAGIGSITVSGHKFLGAPTPCGVVLIRDSVRGHGGHVSYTDTVDSTITGSRCGLAAALLWHAIATHGREGHRWRASEARTLAAYTVYQLTAAGWPAWRHPHAFTVVLPTPPEPVRKKWLLATHGDTSHIICMPGITRAQIDAFVADITAASPHHDLTRTPSGVDHDRAPAGRRTPATTSTVHPPRQREGTP